MNIAPAIQFITEREAIRRRREAGEPAPWTVDPILRDYSFCNVRREHDRVTRHIAANWREPNKNDPDLFFAMAVARLVNYPETLDEIGYPVPWDREKFRKVMAGRKERGEKIFGSAYTIPMGKKGQDTASFLESDVLHPLWKARAHLSPRRGNTLATICDRLRQFNGLAGFIAGQIVADLKYVEPLRSAPDWQTFAVSGPGSRRGLNRLIGRPIDSPWTEDGWRTVFRRFDDAIRPELERLGLGDLHGQDLQSVLCEVDKYLRTRLNEGTPKRRFPGGAGISSNLLTPAGQSE